MGSFRLLLPLPYYILSRSRISLLGTSSLYKMRKRERERKEDASRYNGQDVDGIPMRKFLRKIIPSSALRTEEEEEERSMKVKSSSCSFSPLLAPTTVGTFPPLISWKMRIV